MVLQNEPFPELNYKPDTLVGVSLCLSVRGKPARARDQPPGMRCGVAALRSIGGQPRTEARSATIGVATESKPGTNPATLAFRSKSEGPARIEQALVKRA
jgi:hypothetical protein